MYVPSKVVDEYDTPFKYIVTVKSAIISQCVFFLSFFSSLYITVHIVADSNSLVRALQDIQAAFTFPKLEAFRPVWMMVVTWVDVQFSSSNPNIVSNFTVGTSFFHCFPTNIQTGESNYCTKFRNQPSRSASIDLWKSTKIGETLQKQ